MGELSDNNSNLNGDKDNRKKKVQLDPELLPVNKHAPTPLEKQRVQVAKLLQNTAREIHLPKAPKEKSIRPPREMMKNVQGSSAGAGSGEFHVYKQSRRREYERLRLMDENEEKERLKAEFEKKQAELKEIAESKTNKNRLKRQKKKENMRKKKQQKTGRNDTTKLEREGEGKGSDSDDDSDEDEDHETKKTKKLGAAPIAQDMVFKRPNLNDEGDDDDDNHEDNLEPKFAQESLNELNTSSIHDLSTNVPMVQSSGLTIVEDEW